MNEEVERFPHFLLYKNFEISIKKFYILYVKLKTKIL